MITSMLTIAASAYSGPSAKPKEMQNTFTDVLRNSRTNSLSAAKVGPIADYLINIFKAQLQVFELNKYNAQKYWVAEYLARTYSGPNYKPTSADEWYDYLNTPQGSPLLAEPLKLFNALSNKERADYIQYAFNKLTAKDPKGPFAMGRNALNDTLNRLANASLDNRKEVLKWFPGIVNVARFELNYIDGNDRINTANFNRFVKGL